MPKVSGAYAASDQDEFRAMIILASRLRFWGALTAGSLLAAIGKPILLLFGETCVAGYQALLIVVASQVGAATLGPTAYLLSITGFQNKCLRVFLVSSIVMIALYPLLIGKFGVNGAAGTVFAVVMLQSVWLHRLVVRHLGVNAWAFTVR